MTIPRSTALCLSVLVATARVVAAGDGVWTSYGPDSGTVATIAVAPDDPTVVYAGTWSSGQSDDSSVTSMFLRGTNNGAIWKGLVAAPPGTIVQSIEIDPSDSRLIYGLAADFGPTGASTLYLSADRGASWTLVQKFDEEMAGIVLDPASPETVYVFGSSIWRRSAVGRGWQRVLFGAFVLSLAIDPSDSSVLYAGTYGGLRKSVDGANTWFASGPEAESACSVVRALAVDPRDSRNLLVGYFDFGFNYFGFVNTLACGGAFASHDGGMSWSAITVFPFGVSAFVYDRSEPSRVYAVNGSVYRSFNGGETWESFGSGLENRQASSLVIGAGGSNLYAATLTGVYDLEIPTMRDVVLHHKTRPKPKSVHPRP